MEDPEDIDTVLALATAGVPCIAAEHRDGDNGRDHLWLGDVKDVRALAV